MPVTKIEVSNDSAEAAWFELGYREARCDAVKEVEDLVSCRGGELCEICKMLKQIISAIKALQ